MRARFSEEEFTDLEAAAMIEGLTTTAYVATIAVATARGQLHPLPSSTAEVMRELVTARTQLRRYGTLLNQAVAKLNALGERDEALGAALSRCDAAVVAMRGAVERVSHWRSR